MEYELALENYQGPLDKLLELVEEKKMEITLVSLAKVTADFLKYLGKLKQDERVSALYPQFLADFLTVASRLILIKSKVLLPSLELSQEEESEIKDLELRLKIYQEIKGAKILIKNRWSELPQMKSREFLMLSEKLFYPPKKVSPETLHSFIAKITGELEKFLKPVATIKNEIISLKAKIEEVLKRITDKAMNFKELHKGKDRNEIIVLFLAILHLIKDQLILAEQRAHFEEITISRK